MSHAIHITTIKRMLQSPEPVDIKLWTRSGEIQWCGGVHVILIVTNISYFCDRYIFAFSSACVSQISRKFVT